MKKKILALCLVVVLAVTAVTGATLAYFTDSEAKTNTFTVGNVDIELTEPKWDEVGSKDAVTVYPGEPLAKDPTVKNIGANPCFVRVSVSNLDQYVTEYGTDAVIKYRTDYTDGKLGENWVDGKDGYFYYTKVLAVGETTDALFDQIVIPFALTNNEAAADIVVTAYAVQAQGAKASWSDVQEMTLDEIQAWFATCMPAETPAA